MLIGIDISRCIPKHKTGVCQTTEWYEHSSDFEIVFYEGNFLHFLKFQPVLW